MLTSMRSISAVIVFTVLASGAIADGATTPIFRNLDPPANEYILGRRTSTIAASSSVRSTIEMRASPDSS